MIVASMALLAFASAVSAQEQEGKLVDRILKPNMSLVNSAQNKQFEATEFSGTKHVRSRSYSTSVRSSEKSFVAERAFSTRAVAVRQSPAEDRAANVSTRSQPAKTDMVYIASAADGARVAPESGRNRAAHSFAGNRPFLAQGKSQKALSARDTPLTIEQVRELLNKNK